MERLDLRETEDKKETRLDSGSNTHHTTQGFLRSRGLKYLIVISVSQGNKGVRGLVGPPGYIVSPDESVI